MYVYYSNVYYSTFVLLLPFGLCLPLFATPGDLISTSVRTMEHVIQRPSLANAKMIFWDTIAHWTVMLSSHTKTKLITQLISSFVWYVAASMLWINASNISWVQIDIHTWHVTKMQMFNVSHCVVLKLIIPLDQIRNNWVAQQQQVVLLIKYRKPKRSQKQSTTRAKMSWGLRLVLPTILLPRCKGFCRGKLPEFNLSKNKIINKIKVSKNMISFYNYIQQYMYYRHTWHICSTGIMCDVWWVFFIYYMTIFYHTCTIEI